MFCRVINVWQGFSRILDFSQVISMVLDVLQGFYMFSRDLTCLQVVSRVLDVLTACSRVLVFLFKGAEGFLEGLGKGSVKARECREFIGVQAVIQPAPAAALKAVVGYAVELQR